MKRDRSIVRGELAIGTRSWLAEQNMRIVDALDAEQAARTAPPEVVHRRVNRETVISQRLTNLRCRPARKHDS